MRLPAHLCALGLLASTAVPAQAKPSVQAFPSTAETGLPYSGAVRAGDTVYVGGVQGLADDGRSGIPGGIRAESRAALAHISDMLGMAGASLEDVAGCTVLLADLGDFPGLNDDFRATFPVDPPTRSTIIVAALSNQARVEIGCTAFSPPEP